MGIPSFSGSGWARVIGHLSLAGYLQSIDNEGWHDPDYRDALEPTGQKQAHGLKGLSYN
jgi:hypothetical protein